VAGSIQIKLDQPLSQVEYVLRMRASGFTC